MDAELKALKSVLRSLVVSSPSQVDVSTLMRDYRTMMGTYIPLAKYGYKEPVAFLRERCSDCFILHGASNNPTLTLIVPETLKHIDKFVQCQKSNSSVKCKGKRRSVPGTITQPAKQDPDLIAKTFQQLAVTNQRKKEKSPDINENVINNYQKRDLSKIGSVRNLNQTQSSLSLEPKKLECSLNNRNHTSHQHINKDSTEYVKENTLRPIRKSPEVNLKPLQNDLNPKVESSDNAVHNFLKKRMSLYSSSNGLDAASSVNGKSSVDDDSSRKTSSSNSIKKSIALEELKQEVLQLVASHPEGVWCTDLLKLYRERHNRELNFGRFGFTSIISLVCTLDSRLSISRPDDTGDWLLRPLGPQTDVTPRAPVPQRKRPRPHRSSALNCNVDPDDALPGIDFDPDVFPVDCMHFMESIPPPALEDVGRGALLDVIVGEVYSPSHFWLLRLGELYHVAMERMMDDMTEYYSSGEGRDRVLATGAVRLGHYCSSLFDRDWHRSLIVNVLDSDTVKVRHVDYGTVDVVSTAELKPLLRKWAQLPAQAVRARLAGVRPGAGGRRWPHAASARLLQRVRDRRLVACVVGRDVEEDILEVFLVDTSTDQDECVSADLIRSGHADARPDSCIRVSPRLSRRSDSDSEPEPDVRSLLTAISQFHDDGSEVSASASELVGQRAKRLPTWECSSDLHADFGSQLVGRDNPLMARFINRQNNVQPLVETQKNNNKEKPVIVDKTELISPPHSVHLARLRKLNNCKEETVGSEAASEVTSVSSSRRLARLLALHARVDATSTSPSSTILSSVKPTLSPERPSSGSDDSVVTVSSLTSRILQRKLALAKVLQSDTDL